MKTELGDPFTYAVIGCAMEVHRELGPGVDERFYHDLLSRKFTGKGIAHVSRAKEHVVHRGMVADTFEADLLFPNALVSELKCLHGGFAPEHYVQLLCYQKFWNLPVGLLFDFAKDSLLHRRVNLPTNSFTGKPPERLLEGAPELGADREQAVALCEAIARVTNQYESGYRDTTYRGLLAAEFSAEGIECVVLPMATVAAAGQVLGETRCDCLAVAGKFAVLVLALRDTLTATDTATLRTYARLLHLPHGLILNYGRNQLDHCWLRPRVC